MKLKLARLLPLALVFCLALTACGDKGAAGYDPAKTAEALLASDAFTEALDTLDKDIACQQYGLDEADVTDCVVYGSLSAGAEGITVLVLSSDDKAKEAVTALEGYVEDQKAALKDYQPGEVAKLDNAILDRKGATVLLVVAGDHDLAQAALDKLNV